MFKLTQTKTGEVIMTVLCVIETLVYILIPKNPRTSIGVI